MKGILPPQ